MSQTIKLLVSLLCMLFTLSAAAGNPVARKKAVVNSGKARFTVLTPEMIRIEYSEKEQFEDRATFVIQNREMECVPHFTKSEDADFLYIATDKVHLKYRKGTNPMTKPASEQNLTITMNHKGRKEMWYPGKKRLIES